MSLIGAGLLVVVIAVAVLACAALVAGWRLLARRGPGAVVARAAALVGVQALVLLAVLVGVNDHFDFYDSFADLSGHDGSVHVSTSGGRGAAPAVTVRPTASGPTTGKGRARAVHDPGVPVAGSGGRVEQVTLPGPASGVSAPALVLLPAGYHDPANAGRTYPVIEAFHGYPGTPAQWLDAMGLQSHLDAAVAAREIAPSIVVIPTLGVPAGRDTECLDGPAGQPRLATWLTQDVPSDIGGDYRVQATGWATAGFSMGGWCAAMSALMHPGQYSAAISMGGYFSYDPGSWVPFDRTSPQARALDLISLASTRPPAVAVWAETARTDPSSYPSTVAFARAARSPLAVTLAVQAQGGHRTQLWADQLGSAFMWLGSTAAGFRPA